VLQGIDEQGADRPRAAVDGSLDVVDLPLAGLVDKIVADGLVGRIGARIPLMTFDRDGDGRLVGCLRLRPIISAFGG
jgi:hypothetical protein